MAKHTTKLKIDCEALKGVASDFQSDVDQLTGLLKEARADVEALDESWEGGLHDKFMASFKERADAMDQRGHTMNEFSQALTMAATYYYYNYELFIERQIGASMEIIEGAR